MTLFHWIDGPDAHGVGAAFTSDELDLGDRQPPAARAGAYQRLSDALGVPVAVVSQVHGRDVVIVDEVPHAGALLDLTAQHADALVTTRRGIGLAVRVADCMPVLFAAVDGSAIAAAHAGRNGLLGGVLSATVAALRECTTAPLRAWLGPHICGACYEVPADMAADAVVRLGTLPTATSWGTPSIDLAAGAAAQLEALGVRLERVGSCTLHGEGLHSHRRGPEAGRQVGVVWRSR